MTEFNTDFTDFNEIPQRILEIVHSPKYRPIKPKRLRELLGMSKDDKAELRSILRKLVANGNVNYAANHYILPGALSTLSTKSGRPSKSGNQDAPGKSASISAIPDSKRVSARVDKNTRNEPILSKQESRMLKETRKKRAAGDSELKIIVGRFRRSTSGIGFVRPRDAEAGADKSVDIFISQHFTQDATTGDLVSVEVFPEKAKKDVSKIRMTRKEFKRIKHRLGKDSQETGDERGPRGRIIEILERATHRFVGSYYEEGDWGYVQIDGNAFQHPVVVGDPSANSAQPNDKVVVEMLQFPTNYRDGEGVVVEVLGPHGQPGIDTLLIIREYGLPDQFSEPTLQNAREVAEAFFAENHDEIVPRRDLTEETIITIDPADARDFDDAISLDILDNGHWMLGVHIADVSHFVRDGSPLDQEAKDRGTSVYLPDRVIPMLPELISNSLASLQPDKVRFTLSVFMEFTPDGIRCNTEIFPAAIKSAARFNYDEVQEFLQKLPAYSSRLT
ncbi:MAG: RNB domain-containing ribonuclease, partial [Thermoguttaceae bacterium]